MSNAIYSFTNSGFNLLLMSITEAVSSTSKGNLTRGDFTASLHEL